MTNIERAKAQIAKAEREIEIAGQLPETPIADPTIVIQKDAAWIVYKNPQSFGDILAIFDAYKAEPAQVVKQKGWAASVKRSDVEGAETVCPDIFAWVHVSAGLNYGATTSFRIMATLPDGSPAEVHVDVESGHWNRGARHSDLAVTFRADNPRKRPENRQYHSDGPAFLATCAYTWSAATGDRQGGSVQRYGAFMTRDCLAGAIETLAA